VEGKAEAMPGGFICAGKPIPSITVQNFLWHRALGLICREIILSCQPNSIPMRKLILSLFVLCFYFTSKAQLSVAIVAGPQINSVSPAFSLNPDTSSSYSLTKHTGLNFGFIANAALNRKQTVFFRTGALYSARGSQTFQQYDTANVDLTDEAHFFQSTTNLKINYIDIPANLLFKFPIKGKTKFLLGAGAKASLFYNGSTDFSSIKAYKEHPDSIAKLAYKQTIDKDLPVGTAANKYRTLYFSANALTGFEFGRVFITVDYSKGLTDFFKTQDQSHRHSTLGFHLGIFLGNPKAKIEVSDRDKDGVPDDIDECPTLPGTILTKGCPDKDGDGIADKDDKCPDQPGTLKWNGCPVSDTDKDGISDGEDACPDQAGPLQNKGCPLFDKDGDGVLDSEDKCPDIAGEKKYGGCPVPDTDKDGVNDEEDKCPTIAGPKDNQGCPKVTEEQQQKINYAAKRIQFEYKKASLSPTSFGVLDEVVDILKKNPTFHIKVEGHSSGPESESNRILSQKRAESVGNYFTSKGIAVTRITVVGMGSSKHISKDGDIKENPEDRRVELIIF
jgi:outer membrane protein OmpA-like peptidoglycan-associated protein